MKKNKLIKGIALLGLSVSLTGCSVIESVVGNDIDEQKQEFNNAKDKSVGIIDSLLSELGIPKGKSKESTDNTDTSKQEQVVDNFSAELVNLNYEPNSNPIVEVNGGKSTLDINEWNGPKVVYSDLDDLNRVGAATGHLNKENLGKSESRSGQVWKPTGWNNQAKKLDGKDKRPYDRGHLLAYTVTFKLDDDGKYKKDEEGSLDNPKNLFTQTSYSNQTLFQIYERQVRTSLENGSNVIYRVEPLFRGDELVARGARMEAKSDTGDLDFNVYIHNVQPNFEIDYMTGKTKINRDIQIPKN